jgi:hypothetical protein
MPPDQKSGAAGIPARPGWFTPWCSGMIKFHD